MSGLGLKMVAEMMKQKLSCVSTGESFRGREGGDRGCLPWMDKKWQAKSDMGVRASKNRE